jgi:hypothetical protein
MFKTEPKIFNKGITADPIFKDSNAPKLLEEAKQMELKDQKMAEIENSANTSLANLSSIEKSNPNSKLAKEYINVVKESDAKFEAEYSMLKQGLACLFGGSK